MGFTRENRGLSAQHATRATPTRSSHGPMGAYPYAIHIYRSAAAFIHVTLPAPGKMGRTSRTVQIRRNHSSLQGQRASSLEHYDLTHIHFKNESLYQYINMSTLQKPTSRPPCTRRRLHSNHDHSQASPPAFFTGVWHVASTLGRSVGGLIGPLPNRLGRLQKRVARRHHDRVG